MFKQALVAKANRFLDSYMFVSSSLVYDTNAILFRFMTNIEMFYAMKYFEEFLYSINE